MRLAKAETRLDGTVPSMCSFAPTNPTSSSNLRKSRNWKPIDSYRDGDRLFVRVHGDKHPGILLHSSSPVSEARRRATQRNPRA